METSRSEGFLRGSQSSATSLCEKLLTIYHLLATGPQEVRLGRNEGALELEEGLSRKLSMPTNRSWA
jgi:hypothetical protein